MACTDPFDALRIPTESLGTELYLRASWMDVWLNLIERETYPKHTGLTQSVFTIGRNEPASDEETWLPIDLVQAEGDGNACDTTWNETYVGHTETTYSPEQFGLRGPIVCKDELIYGFQPDDFWEKYMVGLTKRSRRSISNRLLKLYSQFVPKSVAAVAYQTYNQASLTLPLSTCEITQEMLDQTAQELMEDGATDPNSQGWIGLGTMGPVFPLYIGLEASQHLLSNNATLRQDVRDAFSSEGNASPLLRRLGAGLVLKNWRHIPNLFPPRYNYAGGAYTRVNTWTVENTSKGQRAVINSGWRTASHEAAFALSPWVFREQVIEPSNSVAGMTFEPTNYFGEWQWVTGGREIMDDGSCYDPLKKYGRHFGEYKHAAKPIFPEYGRMFIFKRCPTTEFECVTCCP